MERNRCLSLCPFVLYRVEVGIGTFGVECLVAVHHRDEVFGVREVDDVVGVAREHDYGLYAVAAHFVFENLVGAFLPHLYQAAALDHDELLPLAVVPVLPLGDAGPGDVHAHLAAVWCVHQLGEGAAVVAVHLQVEHGLFSRQVAEVGREQPSGEAVGRDFGYHQRLRQLGELVEQSYNLSELYVEGCRHGAVAAVGSEDGVDAVELAPVLTARQGGDHLIDEVVDVQQLKFDRRVVDLYRQSVGYVVAEGRHGRVVVRTAPFAEEVRKAVDQHLGARLSAVAEEELLAGELAFAVVAAGVAPDERGLYRRRKHHRARVAVLLEGVEQRRGEAEVALHELAVVLGAVHPGEVEDEVGLAAVAVELLGRRVEVVLEDLFYCDGTVFGFPVLYVVEPCAEVAANEALGARYEYFHIFFFRQEYRRNRSFIPIFAKWKSIVYFSKSKMPHIR